MRDSRLRHPSRRASRVLCEALDRRTLLSVAFKFNIIDPADSYKSIRPQLQNLLDAAGGEWASHLSVLDRNVTLEYDVAFSASAPPPQFSFAGTTIQLMSAAPKSVVKIGTDTLADSNTGKDVYQPGTITEMKTGVDPNGAKADAGITIFVPNLKYFYFDPHLNRRSDPIPAGYVDGYSALLHEMAHTLGFLSARDVAGNLNSNFMYAYDQHIQTFGTGFYEFGNGTETFNPQTGNFEIDPSSDNAFKVYGTSVPLLIGNGSELGQGRFVPIQSNPDISYTFFLNNFRFQDDLSTDLMGGAPAVGERKTVSKLDLAILKDAGAPINMNLDTSPDGPLEIDGTGLSDQIDVTISNGTLLIRVNDALQSYTPTQSVGISAIVINGLAGNDYILIHGVAPAVAINGGAGNDTIIGGPKGDSISGGGGSDLIYGGSGGDVIHGGDSKDIIYGQGGSDRLFGDASSDFLDGGVQSDKLYGGGNPDTLVGGIGDDFIFGEAGNDVLSGAGGKDRMDGGSGADAYYGGNGNDSVDYSGRFDGVGITASIDGNANDGAPGEGDNIFSDIENIIGTIFDDRIVGSDGPNSLMGGAGNDTLDGIGGNDTLEGNAGNDVLVGSGGDDSILGGDGNDKIYGLAGRDHMLGEAGDDSFFANDTEIDTLDGGLGNDSATADTIDELNAIENPTLVGNPLPPPG